MASKGMPVSRLIVGAIGKPKKEALVVILQVYIDETGTDRSADEPMMLFGCISTPLRWGYFDKKWARALRKEHVSEAHAKEMVARSGEFEGWGNDRAKNFASKLDSIIHQHVKLAFSTVLSRKAFNEYKTQDKDFKNILDSDYGVSFRAIVGFLEVNLPQVLQKDDLEIYLFVADGHPNCGCAKDIVKQVRKESGGEIYIKSVTYVDSSCYGVQGSDIHAYVLLQEEREGGSEYREFNVKTQINDCIEFAKQKECPTFRIDVTGDDLSKLRDMKILSKKKLKAKYQNYLSSSEESSS